MPGRAIRTSLVVLAIVAIGGTSSAFWGGSGGGNGSGDTGTAEPMTLSPGTAAANLHPGGQTDVVLTVSNPNASDVHIGSLSLDGSRGTGGFAVDAGHSACALAALSFTEQNNGGSGWTVPAKVGAVDGTLAATLPDALSMSVDAANACQGASLTVYLTAGS